MADLTNSSLNDNQIRILKTINEGNSSMIEIASQLNLPFETVQYYLDSLEEEKFIQGAKAFLEQLNGRRGFVSIILTDKGKVAANNPEHLIPEKSPSSKNIYTGGGDYREINSQGGRYIENKGTYIENFNQSQSLADAAAEIQKLLNQLDQTYPVTTTTDKMAIAIKTSEQIESDPPLAQRILSAAKAGGVSALESFLNHPAASFVIGALEDWQATKQRGA